MWDDIRSAFSFLTILPLGFSDKRKAGWAFAWYPLVGLFIGYLLMNVSILLPFDAGLTAILVLFTWVFITGGLHLDGFGDSCDGLFATTSPPRRLEIMKDPRMGTWGTVGLILLLLIKWQAIQQIPLELLILPPMLGRWVMVLAVYYFPTARSKGLSTFFRDGFGVQQVVIATFITLYVSIQFNYFTLMMSVLCVGWLLGKWASSRLGGGLTGDVYGAMCEVTEVVCLLFIGASYG